MAALDLDCPSVRNRFAYIVGVLLSSGLVNGATNRVSSLLGFPNGLASGVGNFPGASFPNRLTYRVSSLLGFPNGLANGVANVAGARFPNRLAHGVGSLLGFPNRLANGVANIAGARFPNRLAHGVGSLLGFPNRLANGVANLFLTLLANITLHIDNPIFADPVVDSPIAGNALAFPFHATDGFHHGMATPLVTARRTAIVPCGSTVTRLCYRR